MRAQSRLVTQPLLMIADDDVGLADALRRALMLWFRVTAPVNSLSFLPVALELARPHAVLLDIAFGDKYSLPLMSELIPVHPDTRFIMYTGLRDPLLVHSALLRGAHGFLTKPATLTEVRDAVIASLGGAIPTPPYGNVSKPGMATLDRGRRDPHHQRTGDTVLWLLKTGETHESIARKLHIHIKTVEMHVTIFRRKLGVARTDGPVDWNDPQTSATLMT